MRAASAGSDVHAHHYRQDDIAMMIDDEDDNDDGNDDDGDDNDDDNYERLPQLDDLYFKSFCMTDGDRCRMGRYPIYSS